MSVKEEEIKSSSTEAKRIMYVCQCAKSAQNQLQEILPMTQQQFCYALLPSRDMFLTSEYK